MWVEQLLLEFHDVDLKLGYATFQALFYIEGDDYQGMLTIEEHDSLEKCAREMYMSLLESKLKEKSNVG